MSFTIRVKNEIINQEYSNLLLIPLLSGIIRNIGTISQDRIEISTENSLLAKFIFSTLKNKYNITSKVTVRKRYNFTKRLTYLLTVYQGMDLLLTDLSLNKSIPDDFIYSSDEELITYLKGCFLASGSVSDPNSTRYHLEIIVDKEDYGLFISELLNSYDLNSKVINRKKGYLIYLKEAEKISDFLKLFQVNSSVLYYEDIRIFKDHKNMINRLNNCEQANVNKIFITANNQIKDIDLIIKENLEGLLDEKDQIIINYRKDNPESSLQELSDIISRETTYKITKSGLSHRFRKIRKIAENIKKK